MDLLTLVLMFVTFKFVTCSPMPSEKQVKVEELWGQLEMKARPFLTMPHGEFRVPIYEHRDNDPKADGQLFYLNRYFYAPVPVLNHSSIQIANETELNFRIEMWNSRLERDVASHLKDAIGREIKLQQLQIVPFERLLLTGQSAPFGTKFWRKYELEKSVSFSLPCGKECQELKADPKLLAKDLMLKFTVDSALSLRGQLTVHVDEVIAAIPTYRKIRGYFSRENEICVTSEIFEQLINETADYVEREILGREKVLMSGSFVRKRLHSIVFKDEKPSYNTKNLLIYPPEKETKKAKEEEDYDDYDKLLIGEDEPERNISYYAISLERLESDFEPHQMSHVYALTMFSASVRANDSVLYKENTALNQKETEKVDLTLVEKRFKELEKQLLSQMEKAKDEATRGTKSEVQKLYNDLRKVKSQTCPHNIGPQSFCEVVPFFGCYCFSIDKKRHHHEAAALCKGNGMKLVSLDTRSEKEQFVAIIERERRLKELMFWTSGTRVNSRELPAKSSPNNKGVTNSNPAWGWTWTGSGKPISNWNWMPYEPEKREGHDYVVINYPTRYYQTYPAGGLLYAACETRFGWPIDP